MAIPKSKSELAGKVSDWIVYDECRPTDEGCCVASSPVYYGGKYAPVAPYHFYQQFVVNGYVPKTVLLLAHDVVAHAQEYEDTFNHVSFNDTNIIMDNSVIELGKAVDTEMVFAAAEIVAADIVVLPDALNDSAKTVKLSSDVYEEWKWKFRDYKLMALIQGKSVQDWLECAELLKQHACPDWIGVPRCAEGISGMHRHDLVSLAQMVFPGMPTHLFGFSDHIWWDIFAARHPAVKSIDSAAPLRISDANRILSETIAPRGDWWESATYNKEHIDICKKIDLMISGR